jgi:flagellar biosynthesis protein FliP
MQSHMKQARDRILSCFVNGLYANYELSCRAMKLKNLSEAFNICIELRNAFKIEIELLIAYLKIKNVVVNTAKKHFK